MDGLYRQLHVFTDVYGVSNVRGDIKADRRWRHLPVPSGPSAATGPPQVLQRGLALHHGDMEVRTNQGLLQGPHAVSPTCNAEYMPSYAHMGKVHQ